MPSSASGSVRNTAVARGTKRRTIRYVSAVATPQAATAYATWCQ